MPRDLNVVASAVSCGGAKIAGTLIDLARIAKPHRVLVAGALASELLIALHRHGCLRVATSTCCGAPRGQYDAALVAWQGSSLEILARTLQWLTAFLGPDSVLAVWVGRSEGASDRKLRTMLQRLGFRVEAGTICQNGLAVAARRLELLPAAKAA
jgi:hypothetical protein